MTEENFKKATQIERKIFEINEKLERLKSYPPGDKYQLLIKSGTYNFILYDFDDNQGIIQQIKNEAIAGFKKEKAELQKQFEEL